MLHVRPLMAYQLLKGALRMWLVACDGVNSEGLPLSSDFQEVCRESFVALSATCSVVRVSQRHTYRPIRQPTVVFVLEELCPWFPRRSHPL